MNETTGEVWWPEVSKEVFADGVRGASDAYWRWQKSRAGKVKGRKVGFPRFKKRGKDRDRFSFSTGTMRLEPDRRHLTLPVLGTLRTQENTRRLERLVATNRAKILGVTVSRQGERIIAALRVSVARPQQAGVTQPESVVGIDVGVRRLATVATTTEVIGELANPHALEHRLKELRRLQRQRSRRTRGSRQYQENATKITRLHAEVATLRHRHDSCLHHHLSPKPTACWWSKAWTCQRCCNRRVFPARVRADADFLMQEWVRSVVSFATSAPGMGPP